MSLRTDVYYRMIWSTLITFLIQHQISVTSESCDIRGDMRYQLHPQMQPSSPDRDITTIENTGLSVCVAKCMQSVNCKSAYYQVYSIMFK